MRRSLYNTGAPARLALAVAWLLAALCLAPPAVATPPGDRVIRNEAVSSFLFRTGQRVILRSNLTETLIHDASVAADLALDLARDALVGNGRDSCLVSARISDPRGKAVPDGQRVSFSTSAGTFSNGTDTISAVTSDGVAATLLRSSTLNGNPLLATVTGTTPGVGGRSLVRQHAVLFYPGGVTGTLLSSDQPLAGLPVTVLDADKQVAGVDTTGPAGIFLVPLHKGGQYTVLLHYRDGAGDVRDIHAFVSVPVPGSGGVPAVSPLNVITGRLTDAATGQPLRKGGVPVMVTRADPGSPKLGRALPLVRWTDDRGIFTFDSLDPGPVVLQSMDPPNTGQVTVRQTGAGLFVLDADIAVSGARGFEITKTCNQRIVEIGDIVSYAVEVKNTGDRETFYHLWLRDDLPVSFAFARGTARRDGQPLPDPALSRQLCWPLADSLAPGKCVRVTYAVQIGSGALESDGLNRARAFASTARGDTVQTGLACAQVTVRPGLFTDRGIVVGKVFYDSNMDGRQTGGEEGIRGVELLMEDGTRVVTGDDGKYSLPEVRPGQHVIRVNQRTLPPGSICLAPKSDFAGDGLSRFVRLTDGGIARADFYVKRPGR